MCEGISRDYHLASRSHHHHQSPTAVAHICRHLKEGGGGVQNSVNGKKGSKQSDVDYAATNLQLDYDQYFKGDNDQVDEHIDHRGTDWRSLSGPEGP